MGYNYGWETSDADIGQALDNLALPNGETDVEEVREYLNLYQVECAALYGEDMFEQTDFAIEDIECQISEHC